MSLKSNQPETLITPAEIPVAYAGGVYSLAHPLTSIATGLSTSAIDLLTSLTLGHRFKLISLAFVTTTVGADGEGDPALQVFNLEIGSTNVTGGVVTLNAAATNTIGKVTAGTAITALNEGSATDTISIEMADAGVAFASGAGYFVIMVQNLDG